MARLNNGLALMLANIAKNEFVGNFKREGFDGSRWKRRKSKKQPNRNLLVKSGRLRRDVANSVNNGRKNGKMSYTLVVENEYAKVHNEGGDKMPQRQFVGNTPKLNKKIIRKIEIETRKIWGI